MIAKEDLIFQEGIYSKSHRVFQFAEEYLGISLHVHAEESTLKNGQIFLFNHFARFETMIPAYIFYQRFNQFTRTIADHHLFDLNPKLDEFLCGAGAVPNNLPGLLPFLAAELLKGHKVVIFPEGAMIKNKQVMDDDGHFRIFSKSQQRYLKHHRGAAVLALTLELFKRRIRDLFKKGDITRLNHWTEALELKDHDELKEKVEKPSLIVPGTITFNPIRTGSNFISKALHFFNKDISEGLIEEVIIEGNIVLKDTDMDIRFGKPIEAHQTWHWWGKAILNRYFLSIRSLDELFSLKNRAETWSERLLTQFINRETNRIRDKYMRALYTGLTINTAHIASALIITYIENGKLEINKNDFHQGLYLIIKALQQEPDIHLNAHLSNPEHYRSVKYGQSTEFKQFLKTAFRAKLIATSSDNYIFKAKLNSEHSSQQVRIENPILVSANEAEPILEISAAINKVLSRMELVDRSILASQMWDDELRTFEWNNEEFNKPKFNKVNQYETAHLGGEPFLLTQPKDKPTTGILLVHGFLASPAEMIEYGEHLQSKGFNVLGVRLAGHGTSPCDLNTRTYEEWLESVRRSYAVLSAYCEEIIIVGFSAGGALALLFSSGKPSGLKAIVSVCAALEVRDKGIHFAGLLDSFNKLASFLPFIDGILNYKKSGTKHIDTNYRSIPIRASKELKKLMGITQKNLNKIEIPALVIQSTRDIVVEPESATTIIEGINSKNKQLEWIESASHDLIRNKVKNTWSLIDNFIEQLKELKH